MRRVDPGSPEAQVGHHVCLDIDIQRQGPSAPDRRRRAGARSSASKIAGYFDEPDESISADEIPAGITHGVRSKRFDGVSFRRRAVVLSCGRSGQRQESCSDGSWDGIWDADVFSTAWMMGTDDAVDDGGARTAGWDRDGDKDRCKEGGPDSLPHHENDHTDWTPGMRIRFPG